MDLLPSSAQQVVVNLIKQFNMMKKMMDQMGRQGGKGPFGKIKAFNQARKQFADIGGMMQKMMAGDSTLRAGPGKAPAPPSALSKDEIRRRRKMERQRRRRGRR